MPTWDNNLNTDGVGSVFSGILGQLNYLKSRIDVIESAGNEVEGEEAARGRRCRRE